MARVDGKGQRFEFLVGRTDEAIQNGYYVEAESLIYALFEERTYALLDQLGIHYVEKNHKLFQCLEKFTKAVTDKTICVTPTRCTQDELLQFLQNDFLDSGLVANIQTWRSKRNDVIHDLAKQEHDGEGIRSYYNDLKDFAVDGRKYFALYTAAIMRLKKKFRTHSSSNT